MSPLTERKLPDSNEPLTDWEKALLEKFFSDPSQLPAKFKTWVSDYVSTNGSFNVSSLPTLKGEEWRDVGATGQPAFQNSWVNYGGGNEIAAFMKDASGFVHIKGLIANGTQGTVGFTLPAGYRPPEAIHFAALSNNLLGRVRVLANGEVWINEGPMGSNGWVSLAQCMFRAA